jgi:hypothetical protein
MSFENHFLGAQHGVYLCVNQILCNIDYVAGGFDQYMAMQNAIIHNDCVYLKRKS